eukprot:GHVN01030425.1.p1 GENE.GHVN01030425.1~~GHVN01030425.1.p1  ORF type:complete len:456 (+),score=106.02 GHVN01030425.1:39-1370(+)
MGAWVFKPFAPRHQEGVKPSTAIQSPPTAADTGDAVSPRSPLPPQSKKPIKKFEDIDPDDTCLGLGKFITTRLEGKRRSLLIGINYFGQKGELKGCITDVERMRVFLRTNGFPDTHEQHVLTDQPAGTYDNEKWVHHAQPTKKNILESIQWLVGTATVGDSLFFHFSGHGVRVPDENGDEEDGFDESIVPVDYREEGVIIDDLLNVLLVQDIPRGARLTVIMDCCHSGSALDLPYTFEARTEEDTKLASEGKTNFHVNKRLKSKLNRLKKKNINKKAAELEASGQLAPGTAEKVATTIEKKNKLFKTKLDLLEEVKDPAEREVLIAAAAARVADKLGVDVEDLEGTLLQEGEVVKFSGCEDEQTSADVSSTKMFDLPQLFGPDAAGGACSGAFLSSVHSNQEVSYVQLLEDMRKDLVAKGFKQIPQLSSTTAFDLHSTFDMTK